MGIEIKVTGKCVGCPCLIPDISTLYANNDPAEWVISCENRKLCDRIENHLEKNHIGDPLY